MLKLAIATAALLAAAAATAQDAASPPPPAPTVTKISAADMAHDPRMIAALRHADQTADHKCGEGVGGQASLEVKTAAHACRRRMEAAARADAEFEINGGN